MRAPEFANRPHLVDVLRRSHARSCQITAEILTLLEGGFADGAMARWRTLHEIAVTASFIAEHGEELAERYVLHQAVESKRAADQYEECVPRLGYEPPDATTLQAIQDEFDAVIGRFGRSFRGSYGWAAQHLGMPPNRTSCKLSVPSARTTCERTTGSQVTTCTRAAEAAKKAEEDDGGSSPQNDETPEKPGSRGGGAGNRLQLLQ